MIGSAADSARSSRHSAKPPSGSSREADVEQREVGQPGAERGERRAPVGERAHLIAVLLEHVGVVGADCRIVLDDGHYFCHAANIPEAGPLKTACHRFATIHPRGARFALPPTQLALLK